MSVSRPVRSLVGKCLTQNRSRTSILSCQQFHTSTPQEKGRPRFRNITAEELDLTNTKDLNEYRKETFPPYSKKDLQILARKYTPEQIEAIQAGEATVNTDDIINQGRIRDDAFRPEYTEDYTTLDPRFDVKPKLDFQPREPEWLEENEWIDKYAEKITKITETRSSQQLTRAMARALRKVNASSGVQMLDLTEDELKDLENNPEVLEKYLAKADSKDAEIDPKAPPSSFLTRAQAIKLDAAVDKEWKHELKKIKDHGMASEVMPSNMQLMEDGPGGDIRAYSAEAPELGKVPGVEGLHKAAIDPADQGKDDSGQYKEIKRLTGMTLAEVQSLYRKVLVLRWVSNQTRLGKVRSTAAVAIAGNGNGRLGLGFAKSTEPSVASSTAELLAIRNMKPIRRYEDRTIYGNVKAKISGTVVELFSRPPGKELTFCYSPKKKK